MIAYITGGSKGIGFGIAEAVLKAGGKVALTARTLESAEAAAGKLAEHYDKGNILALSSTVTDLGEEKAGVDQAVKKFGKIYPRILKIDILMNLKYGTKLKNCIRMQWKNFMINTMITLKRKKMIKLRIERKKEKRNRKLADLEIRIFIRFMKFSQK